jgi:hypothetical protein
MRHRREPLFVHAHQRRVLRTPAEVRRVQQVVDDECMERRGYTKKS